MKHRFRFFGERLAADIWQIDPADQVHLKRVLKLKPGEPIEVGNGCGLWAEGTLDTHAGEPALRVIKEHHPTAPAPVILLLGALKHGDFDELVAPLTEVGVTQCFLFLQAGSEKSRLADKARARWQKLCVAAMKQAKTPYLMEIRTFATLEKALLALPAQIGSAKYCLDAGGPSILTMPVASAGGVAMAVGSEKGLSDAEWSELQSNGFHPASIGPHILRAKTAAILAGGLAALRLLNSN